MVAIGYKMFEFWQHSMIFVAHRFLYSLAKQTQIGTNFLLFLCAPNPPGGAG